MQEKLLKNIKDFFIDLESEGFEFKISEEYYPPDSNNIKNLGYINICISKLSDYGVKKRFYDTYECGKLFTSEDYENILPHLEIFCERVEDDLEYQEFHFKLERWYINTSSTTFIEKEGNFIDPQKFHEMAKKKIIAFSNIVLKFRKIVPDLGMLTWLKYGHPDKGMRSSATKQMEINDKRIRKFNENFKLTKDDIIEKIKSIEYILNDENIQVWMYGSKFDYLDKLTISIRVVTRHNSGASSVTSHDEDKVNNLTNQDFFLEYLDRLEQLCHDEKVFESISIIDIRINGNTFVFIDKNGQKNGVAYPKKEEIKTPNTYGDDDYANPTQESIRSSLKKFKLFKSKKEICIEKFKNLFEIDVSDVLEIMRDISDNFYIQDITAMDRAAGHEHDRSKNHIEGYYFSVRTTSKTIPLKMENGKFCPIGSIYEKSKEDIIHNMISDSIANKHSDKEKAAEFFISFRKSGNFKDKDQEVVEETAERLKDLIGFDKINVITNKFRNMENVCDFYISIYLYV